MRLVTPLEMLKLEESTNASGCTYDQMMEHAGKGLAEHLSRYAKEAEIDSILFLCGNGNNAGDCFVAARLLSKKYRITVCMVCGPVKTRTAHMQFRAMQNVKVLHHQEEIKEAVRSAQFVVDGVFGIGFRGELSPNIRELFAMIEENEAMCIAVDIPSGGSGMSGVAAEGTPHCTATVTFGAAKIGLFLAPLSEYCGAIYLVEIACCNAEPAVSVTQRDVRQTAEHCRLTQYAGRSNSRITGSITLRRRHILPRLGH